MSRFQVKILNFYDLNDMEKEDCSDNGCGKESATYIQVIFEGETLILESDAMEQEDAFFHRDLRWVSSAIQKAFECGLASRE